MDLTPRRIYLPHLGTPNCQLTTSPEPLQRLACPPLQISLTAIMVPDLLNRRPRPPQRRPFTDSLVRPFAGSSYKPSSAATYPPHRKHCTTRPPKPSSTASDPLQGRHIQLHRPCFTDAAASSGYFDLYSFGFSLYHATVHLPQMSFLVCRQAPQP